MLPHERRKRRAGVSLLLEVVIGLGVFAGAVLVSLGVISFSDRAAVGARNHTTALSLCKGALDNELSKTFGSVADSVNTLPIQNENAGVVSSVNFQVSVKVTNIAANQDLVTVEVSWPENNRTRKVTLQGYSVNA